MSDEQQTLGRDVPSVEATAAPTDAAAPPPAPEDALGAVVDDYADRHAAAEWAADELIAGRSFEAVAADLAGQGWGGEDIEYIVELARKATREHRGVVTRESVARSAEREYRTSMASMRWFAFGGLPGILMAVKNVIRAVKNQMAAPRRPKADEPGAGLGRMRDEG